ncbi:MAG: fibronectin type III domain-containing protein, partial [Thermoplasmata archaeon]|nr:fibronectin type III domain-containing protein [Thermoplasmata archaeon]
MRPVLVVAMAMMLSMGPLAPALGTVPEHIAIISDSPGPIVQTPFSGPLPEVELNNIDGHFTENLGQLGDGAGTFYCQGEPLSVALGPGWVSYLHRSDASEGAGVLVMVDFEGSNPVEPVGVDPLPHPTNYLKGNDPDLWVVGARSFREVVYEDLWDGIDLRYRFADGMLKYDLLVEPFADISQVNMHYSGQERLMVDATTGDLIIRTPVVDLVDQAPISFQGSQPEGDDIWSSYKLMDGSLVGFQVEGFDPSRPLVIDPGLSFSTYIGGNSHDGAYPHIDDEGNIYLVGHTESTDFPTTSGVIQNDDLVDRDGFVCKLSSDGFQLLFSTYIGTDGFDTCMDLLVDESGNIVVTGQTDGTDFPTTANAYQTDLAGWADAFLMTLNEDCSAILSCTLLGGKWYQAGTDLGWMSNGDIMVFGFTNSEDFPVVDGCFDTTYNGDNDSFLARMDLNGSTLIRSTYLGGLSDDFMGENSELVVDDDDEVYIALTTASYDYPVSQNAFSKNLQGCHDAVVTKMDGDLTTIRYSTFLGGTDHDGFFSLTVDEEGHVYLVGTTYSLDFPTTQGAWQDELNESEEHDVFLSKLSIDGSSLEFSTYFGGEGIDWGSDIQLGPDGHVYFTMNTESQRLPTTEHAYDPSFNGVRDIYIGVLDGENQTLRYGSYFGGSDWEGWWPKIRMYGGSVILTGATTSIDFPTTLGAYDRSHNGGYDVTVSRFDPILSDPVLPDAPRNLAATLIGRSVELAWDPPAYAGGFNLWGFTLYRGTSNATMAPLMDLSPTMVNLTDIMVQLGSTYHYALTAYSPAGEGPMSNEASVWVVIPPAPPGDVLAEPSDRAVRLEWTTPIMTGGLPIMGYHVWRGTTRDDLSHLVALGNVTGYLDEDLENADTYYYGMAAFNQLFNSTLSPLVSAIPRGPPSAPQGFEVTPGNGKISLKWSPPLNNGGMGLEGFKLLRGTDPASLTVMYDLDASDMAWIDGPLENGVEYYYAVLAYNRLGDGDLSPIVKATTYGPPGAPLELQASEHEGRIVLSWAPPEGDGGSPIEGYMVFRGSTVALIAPYRTLHGPVTEYEDTGLLNGMTYHYAVLAYNQYDQGGLSDIVTATPRGPPEVPRALVTSGGVGKVTLSWLPPERDGGSAITGYTIRRGTSPGAMTSLTSLSEPVTRYEDNEVIPGTRYHYTITALNALGEGEPTGTVTALPITFPTVPFSLTYERTEGAVVLTWTAPQDDGGSMITSYRVYRGGEPTNMAYLTEMKDGNTLTDRTLVPGRTYYYAVSAVNEAGEGVRSPAIEIQPAVMVIAPGPPLGLKAEVMDDAVKLTLTWRPPEMDGGSPVTSYTVYKGGSSGDLVEIARMGMLFSFVDYDVEEGSTYRYAVAAENAAGVGEMSRVVKVTIEPQASPGPFTPLLLLLVGVLVIIVFVIVVAGAVIARFDRAPLEEGIYLAFITAFV